MHGVLIACALIAFWVLSLFVRARKRQARYQDAIDRFVDFAFRDQTYRPEAMARSAYGIPAFALRFETDAQKEHAISSGLTEQVLSKVQELCGNLRPRGEAFSAAKAVAIYSADDDARWKRKAAAFGGGTGRERST